MGALTEQDFDSALARGWPDLEDACVFEVARSAMADAIITRNVCDFSLSTIPVFDPVGFFTHMASAKGIDYFALCDV